MFTKRVYEWRRSKVPIHHSREMGFDNSKLLFHSNTLTVIAGGKKRVLIVAAAPVTLGDQGSHTEWA